VLKHKLTDGGSYEVRVSVGDRSIEYHVPADDQEDDAWSEMLPNFESHPDLDGARYWRRGQGWITEEQLMVWDPGTG
jgi:hypothetical protein